MLALTPSLLHWTVPPLQPGEAGWRGPARQAPPGLVSSLSPALDLAFGLDRHGAIPEEIASRLAALHRGPLGHPANLPAVSAETLA